MPPQQFAKSSFFDTEFGSLEPAKVIRDSLQAP